MVPADESARGLAHHVGFADVASSHVSERNVARVLDKIEATLKALGVIDVREVVAREDDLGAALHRSTFRAHVKDLWLSVVAEFSASVNPINTVEGHLDGQGNQGVVVGRSVAHDSDSGDEGSTNHLLTNLALGNDSVLGLVVKPRTRDFQFSSTLHKTSVRLNLLHDWLNVIVVLYQGVRVNIVSSRLLRSMISQTIAVVRIGGNRSRGSRRAVS